VKQQNVPSRYIPYGQPTPFNSPLPYSGAKGRPETPCLCHSMAGYVTPHIGKDSLFYPLERTSSDLLAYLLFSSLISLSKLQSTTWLSGISLASLSLSLVNCTSS